MKGTDRRWMMVDGHQLFLVVQPNRIVLVLVLFQVPLKKTMNWKNNRNQKTSSHYLTNPSADTIDHRPSTPTMDEQEHLVNSDDEDEQTPIPMDDGQTECKIGLSGGAV